MEPRATMSSVSIVADAIVSPLGDTTSENMDNLFAGKSGISPISSDDPLGSGTLVAGRVRGITETPSATRFENLCLKVLRNVARDLVLPPSRTILILSTTKGNIDWLGRAADVPRKYLHESARFLAEQIGLRESMVVSNACVSGVMAMIVAKRMLHAGRYDHAVVVGADELTRFVVSGFQSLQALSSSRCRPFDAARDGINLGEAAAAVVMSSQPKILGAEPTVRILGTGISNDANHISGPSRTGEELYAAIDRAIRESGVTTEDVDFVSAHGTATRYNDEMEAKAFSLAGLNNTPIHSLKGSFGHTLGAAGLIETVAGIHSMLNNRLIPSAGFETIGVSSPLNIIRSAEERPLNRFLKTASGFGGCNAAIVLEKNIAWQ